MLRRQVDTLSAQVGRVEAQRDNLLRRLSSLEERAERAAGPAVPPAGQG